MSAMDAQAIAKKARMGLEELLKTDARVLYEKIFSTRHIGRVLDFMLFECKAFIDSCPNPGYAEYRVRHALELGIFNGWSNFRKGGNTKCVELEFGWDDERLVLSIAHYADDGVSGFVPGSGEPADESSARMLKMIEQIQSLTDGLLVRHDPQSGRVQVVAFITASEGDKVVDTQYIAVDPDDSAMEANPESAAPNPFASGNVDEFIKDEAAALPEEYSAPSANDDEVRVTGSAPEAETETLVRGGEAETESTTTVSGQVPEEDKTEIRISGDAPQKKDDVLRVKGGTPTPAEDKTKFVVKGDSGTQAQDKTKFVVKDGEDATAETSESVNEGVQVLLDTVKSEIMPLCSGLNDAEFHEAFRNLSQKIKENYDQALHHMMRVKNIQMIGKIKNYKDQISVLSARIDELKAENRDVVERLSEKAPEEVQLLKLKSTASAEEYEAKRNEEEEKAKESLMQYKTSLEKGEVPSGAQGWGKGLLETAFKERALVNQRMREIDAHLKKKEFEFKSKETALKEQLRMQEEQVKQKEFTLQKTKESLANALSTIEQQRNIANSAGSDKNELAHKFNTAEKLLSVAKDNNERMQKRLDDIQKKWQEEFNTRSSLQNTLSKQKKELEDLKRQLAANSGQKVDSGELNKATQERDRALRMVDDLKRQNKELQAKLITAVQSAKPAGVGATPGKRGEATMGDAEMKHKLDQANKIAAVMKDELERTKKRFDELKQSETKLRVEVAKLQNELKAAGKNPAAQEKQQPRPPVRSGGSPLIQPKGTKPTAGLASALAARSRIKK